MRGSSSTAKLRTRVRPLAATAAGVSTVVVMAGPVRPLAYDRVRTAVPAVACMPTNRLSRLSRIAIANSQPRLARTPCSRRTTQARQTTPFQISDFQIASQLRLLVVMIVSWTISALMTKPEVNALTLSARGSDETLSRSNGTPRAQVSAMGTAPVTHYPRPGQPCANAFAGPRNLHGAHFLRSKQNASTPVAW